MYSKLYSNIFQLQLERRPCYVVTSEKTVKAMFHRWVDNKVDNSITMHDSKYVYLDPVWWGGNCEVYALVEFENGVVSKINPENLVFADGGDFSETAFIPFDKLDDLVTD